MSNTIAVPSSRSVSQASTSRVPKKGRLMRPLIGSNTQDIGISQKSTRRVKTMNDTDNYNNSHSYTLSDVGLSVKVNKDLFENTHNM